MPYSPYFFVTCDRLKRGKYIRFASSQGLIELEVMACLSITDDTYFLNADRIFCQLNVAHTAHGLTDQVIMKNQSFKAELQKKCVHSCGLIVHIQPR